MSANVRALLLGSLAISVAAAACAANGSGSSNTSLGAGGSSSGSGFAGGGGATGTGAGSSSSGKGTSVSSGSFSTTSTSGAGGLDPDAACGLVTQKAKGSPVDLFILVDQSTSMAGEKWMGAQNGIHAFITDPNSAGLDVALTFFPIDPSKGDPSSCDANQYKTALVPFGPLPANGAMIDSAMQATPSGMSSPDYPALAGAVTAVFDQIQANPTHQGAVLLVTDGSPVGPASCSGITNPDDPAEIAQLAANALAFDPPVHTFVVGLTGIDSTFANGVAAAGGTTKAIVIGSANVGADFTKALAQVRGQTLPCSFDLPDKVANGDIDTNQVNVVYTPSGGQQEILPQDQACMGKGWRYDDPADPTKIIFCAKSCDDLHVDYGASVEILLGCKTLVK